MFLTLLSASVRALKVRLYKFLLIDWLIAVLYVVDVSLDMPDTLDISHLRAAGKQAGEEELEEDAAPVTATAPGDINYT